MKTLRDLREKEERFYIEKKLSIIISKESLHTTAGSLKKER